MKKKWILILMMILCVSLISSCTKSDDVQVEGQISDEDRPKVQEEKKLIFALGGELDNLSSTIMNGQNPGALKLVYEGLVTYGENGIEPCLATSWDISNDGTEITFHLRKNVTFHDGTPFNAEAVKVNLDFYSKGPSYAFIRGVSSIVDMEIINEHTLKVVYKEPYFGILNDLTSPEVTIMVSPNTIVEGNYEGLTGTVGTGPYVYDTFVKGEYTKFKYYDNYWGDKPEYEEVIAKYIPDSTSRLQALKTGEIDMIFGSTLLSYDDYTQAINLAGIEGKISKADVRTRNIAVNASGEMLSNANIRKAVAYAINKDDIVNGLTYGYETVAQKLFPEGTPYTDIKLNNSWSHDVQTARELLNKEGWKVNKETGFREKNGIQLKLVFTYDEGVALNKEIVTAIRSQLAEVGINIESKGLEQMLWWQEDYMGNYDLTIWDVPAAPQIPQQHFTVMLDSSAEMAALSKMKDVENVNTAIRNYLTTTNQESIAHSFEYLINYINDNVIDIPISYTKEVIVYNSNKIDDYKFNSNVKFFDVTGVKIHK